MTTTVKVTTAEWPVEVTLTDHTSQGEAIRTECVEPESEREFHLHSTLSIGLVELPKPEGHAKPEEEAKVDAPAETGAEQATE